MTARLIRIYVPYLPIGVGMLALYHFLPSLSEGGRDTSVLTSLTLLPDNQPPALSMAWTLVHEMIFYAIYALWFIHCGLFRCVLVIWVAAILYVFFGGIEPPAAAKYLLSPLNLYFIAGVGVFQLSRRVTFDGMTAAMFGLSGSVLLIVQVLTASPNRVAIASAFVLLVMAATSHVSAQHKALRPLVVLGAASYAVYLVHNPVLSLAVRLVRVVLPEIGVWSAFSVIVLIATVVGMVYWRWYEQPMLAWVRARLLFTRR